MSLVESNTVEFAFEEKETPIHLLTNCISLRNKRLGKFGSKLKS